ncbi:MAG: hypothetical protein AAF334_07280, partial [Pseudomonadota bacterium]
SKRFSREYPRIIPRQIDPDVEGLFHIEMARLLVKGILAFGNPAAVLTVPADIQPHLLRPWQLEE